MTYSAGTKEILYWAARPSQLVYLKQYIIYGAGVLPCLLLIPFYPIFAIIGLLFLSFKTFVKYWEVKQSQYFLSHERLRIVKGGLWGRRTFDIERYRLIDVELHEPFFHQIFGLGIIEIRNLQWDKEKVTLNGIENPRVVREIIRGVATNSRNIETYLCLDLSELHHAEQRKLLK
ncbi:MAG: PH domain-containing protein [Phaeodactylibacter sp.]|nr:PH domain-containing protein [Phaeodactylibacter sp.]MCB9291968.1 PH domain-containing protein [Lewinellaceae bacterium]